MMVTTGALSIFTTGTMTGALSMPPAPTPLNQALRLNGFDKSPEALARRSVMSRLLAVDTGMPLVRSAHETMLNAEDVAAVLAAAGDPPLPAFPANNLLADQLKQVAKLIALRNALGVNRQIFFCGLGGFDLHNAQAATHATLLGRLSGAMKAFYDATAILGVESLVTTFTLSDFARTFKPNGGLGTDHGWGSHHLVMGGAVDGGKFYGTYPRLAPDGDDDADAGLDARGRWVPTTAVDQVRGDAGEVVWGLRWRHGRRVSEPLAVCPWGPRLPVINDGTRPRGLVGGRLGNGAVREVATSRAGDPVGRASPVARLPRPGFGPRQSTLRNPFSRSERLVRRPRQ